MNEKKLTIQIDIDPDLTVFVDATKSKGMDIITGQTIPKGSPAVWIKSRYGRRIQTWLVTKETYQKLIAESQS